TFIGAFVTEKIIEPRLGEYNGVYREKLEGLQAIEKKGLIRATIATVVTLIAVALLVVTPNAPLRAVAEPGETLTLMESLAPFMDSLVPFIALLFFVLVFFYFFFWIV